GSTLAHAVPRRAAALPRPDRQHRLPDPRRAVLRLGGTRIVGGRVPGNARGTVRYRLRLRRNVGRQPDGVRAVHPGHPRRAGRPRRRGVPARPTGAGRTSRHRSAGGHSRHDSWKANRAAVMLVIPNAVGSTSMRRRPDVTLTQLRYFVKAATYSSMTKAADEL